MSPAASPVRYFESPALVQLQREVNALWPHRDRTSDGWIGDISHQARPSDHNPDWAAGGIVRARDIDEDLVAGLTAAGEAMPLVEQIIRDRRVAYVIYEGRIWQNPAVFTRGGWLPYTGVNAHRHHVHVSIRRGATWDRDGRPWGLVRATSTSGGPGVPNIPGVNVGPIEGIEEVDMPLTEADAELVATKVWNKILTDAGITAPAFSLLIGARLDSHAQEVANAVLGTVVDDPNDALPAAPVSALLTGTRQAAGEAASKPPVTQAALTQAIRDNAAQIAAGIQVVIRDTDMDRIRKAAVEANERTTGEIRDNGLIRFRPRLPDEA